LPYLQPGHFGKLHDFLHTDHVHVDCSGNNVCSDMGCHILLSGMLVAWLESLVMSHIFW